MHNLRFLLFILFFFHFAAIPSQADWRNFVERTEIPKPSKSYDYIEQPLLIEADNGELICVYIANDKRKRGESGWLFATRSIDGGKSWSAPLGITPDGVSAGYHSLYKNRHGRIYAVTYKSVVYSDDHGHSWSAVHSLPEMDIPNLDNRVPAWTVSNAIKAGDHVLFPFARHDVVKSRMESEVFFYKSNAIDSAKSVKALDWSIVPKPFLRHLDWKGHTQRCEEPTIVSLSGDRLYVTARTVNGYIAKWTSPDAGLTWSAPDKVRFSDGRTIKHPKAYAGLWKASNGKYLLWHHFNSTPYRTTVRNRRNPVWISGGGFDGVDIRWSQPEILYYHANPKIGISYSSFIEHKGKVLISAGTKHSIHIGEIPSRFLDELWSQHKNKTVASKGKTLDVTNPSKIHSLNMVPDLTSGGFSVDFWIRFDNLKDNQIILSYRGKKKPYKGWAISTHNQGQVRIEMRDVKNEYAKWSCDAGFLKSGVDHHIGFIVDGKADIISVMIDGVLQDGGKGTHGWTQFSHKMGLLNGGQKQLVLAPTLNGKLKQVRVYNRPLTTSEMVGNYGAGIASPE